MTHLTNQSHGSHAALFSYAGASKPWTRLAQILPLVSLLLLLLPGRMAAQTEEYDKTVTFTCLAGSESYADEGPENLFDGRYVQDDYSKWCCQFSGSAFVVFEASKPGRVVGYTITTGNDNEQWTGRNPKSWKLYGNHEGADGTWTLIQEVDDDKTLKDKNYQSYDFTCEGTASYKYFKWEISSVQYDNTLQVGEFRLKLSTCSHKNADGSSALGEALSTVPATCTKPAYTTHKCSLCGAIIEVVASADLAPHSLVHHEAKDPTCTEAGNIEYWQCSACNKLFSTADASTEITDAASVVIPAKGHQYDSQGVCTVCHAVDKRYAVFSSIDGITIESITDDTENQGLPWQVLDLDAEGMDKLGFAIPEGSTGLMTCSHDGEVRSYRTTIKLKTDKPLLLSFNYANKTTGGEMAGTLAFWLDDRLGVHVSENCTPKEYKVFLAAGEHQLMLESYRIKETGRAVLYNFKTSTSLSDYVAEYDPTTEALTFKKMISDNLEALATGGTCIVNDGTTIEELQMQSLDLKEATVKHIVFDESFKDYTPTTLARFFRSQEALETIEGLQYLNTSKATDMLEMFAYCKKLTTLDLSKFNTDNVTSMAGMFSSCSALTNLDLSSFNTEKVEYMASMFFECTHLASVNLSSFNTANVTKMFTMFRDCPNLTTLDLSSFNTGKVDDITWMFNGCGRLATIYAGLQFTTASLEHSSEMFLNCTSLKGAIEYDASKVDGQYANCTTGYFKTYYKVGNQRHDIAVNKDGNLHVDNLQLEDGKDFVTYAPFTAGTVTYTRQLKGGGESKTMWGSLCLPYSLKPSEAGLTCYLLDNVSYGSDGDGTIYVKPLEADILPAGTPAFFKAAGAMLDLGASDVEVVRQPLDDETTAREGVYLRGGFVQYDITEGYALMNNSLWDIAAIAEQQGDKGQGTGYKVRSKGFRAYLAPATGQMLRARRLRFVAIDDETTAIDTAGTIDATVGSTPAEYFDTNGRKLSAPREGINIVRYADGRVIKLVINHP